MNADENPYASPQTESTRSETDDEEKRRWRVGLMWGCNGMGYITLPWWLPLEPVGWILHFDSEAVWLCLLMLVLSMILAVISFIAALSVIQLGRMKDVVGAVCGIVFGSGFIGITACQMLAYVIREYVANP